VEVTTQVATASKVVHRLAKTLNIDEDDAREFRAACVNLHKLNPRGAWCLIPDEETSMVIDENSAGGEVLHDYLRVAVEGLREMLPRIETIRCDAYMAGSPDGRLKRKAWVRFMSSKDTEEAAINTSAIATHIKDAMIRGNHQFSHANHVRLQAWAKQLNAFEEDMPEILHLVSLCAVNVLATEIRLRPAPRTH